MMRTCRDNARKNWPLANTPIRPCRSALRCLKALCRATVIAIAIAGTWAALAQTLDTSDLPTASPFKKGDQPKVEIVTITSSGFEPARMTRPPGPFILRIENRSALGSLTLNLDVLRGQRIKQVRTKKALLDQSELLDLSPGLYRFSVQEKPAFTFELEVKP